MSKTHRPPAHGGQLRAAAQRYGHRHFLDFSANLNPLGPPAAVAPALHRAIADIVHYPDIDARLATDAVASYLEVDPDCLLLTAGGMEALSLAFDASGARCALMPAPAFGGYRELCEAKSIATMAVPNPLTHPLAAGSLVVLGQPANPTGSLVAKDDLVALWQKTAKAGGTLVLDEAFIDFLPNPESWSLRALAATDPSLIVCGSLTKFFTLPGLRIGYAIASGPLMQALRRCRLPWNVNSLAQAATTVAVQDTQFVRQSRAYIPLARADLDRKLQSLDAFDIAPSAANYLLLDCSRSGLTSATICDGAARAGVLLRDCSNMDGLGPTHLRVAVRHIAEHDQLCAVLHGVLGNDL